MKLYYAPGTCSLAAHIVANEARIVLDLERVDIFATPHVTASGIPFATVNPNGYVPALELDDRTILTEGVAILQYLADLAPQSGLAAAPGTRERVALQSWLNFIATELHKMYSPWLFHPEVGAQAQVLARTKIAERLAHVDRHLAAHGPYLLGDRFTIADAYLFTIVGWSGYAKVDLTPFPAVRAHGERVRARPSVRDAVRDENQKVAA